MINRYRFTILGFVVVALLLGSPIGQAQAHVLNERHGISAVLHMPPDDNPAAGEQTPLYLSFGDSANIFSLQNCRCKVVVSRNGQVVKETVPQPALQGAMLNSLVMVNFPSVGVYDVKVQGSAIDGHFSPFQLNFPVRVAREANSSPASNSGSAVIIIGAGSLAILGLFAYNSIRFGGRYKSSPKGKTKPKKRQIKD